MLVPNRKLVSCHQANLMLSLEDIEIILGAKFVIYVIYKMWKMNIILYLFVQHIIIFVKSL